MAIELHEPLTQSVIRAAIEVHRHLGPGLLESVYEPSLAREMTLQGIPFARQIGIPLHYKGELISEHRPDFIIASLVVLEVKSVERFDPVHTAQVLTYLRVTRL